MRNISKSEAESPAEQDHRTEVLEIRTWCEPPDYS